MRRILLILLMAVPLADAQAPVAIRNARVEGRVVVSMTGEAVPRANLRLVDTTVVPQTGPTGATDNEGKFAFEEVTPGRYTLTVSKPGMLPQAGAILNLKAGTELKDWVIKMTPQAVIEGKVTDQDGDPLNGMQILLLHYDYVQGARHLVPVSTNRTDDQGNFRLINIAPGRYYVHAGDRNALANSANGERTTRPITEGNGATFYPSGAEAGGATVLDVAAGAQLRGIDIRMRRVKLYTISGKIVVPGGGSLPVGGRLLMAPKGIDQWDYATTLNYAGGLVQPDGSFEFRLLQAGQYQMYSLSGNSIPVYQTDTEVSILSSNVSGVIAVFNPLPKVLVTVTVEDSDLKTLLQPKTPVANPPRFFFGLSQVGGGMPMSSSAGQAKDDGTTELTELRPLKYRWTIGNLPDRAYVKSIHFGSQDITRAPLDNTSGAYGSIQIVLSPKGATVTGSVRNDKGDPLQGVVVRVWPKVPDLGSDTGSLKGTTSDQDGTFRVTGLAPGEYYVAAFEELASDIARSPDFQARFNDEAALIKLTEGDDGVANLKMIPLQLVTAELAKLP